MEDLFDKIISWGLAIMSLLIAALCLYGVLFKGAFWHLVTFIGMLSLGMAQLKECIDANRGGVQ